MTTSLVQERCERCGKWHESAVAGIASTRCAVLHPPGQCCHYGERELEPFEVARAEALGRLHVRTLETPLQRDLRADPAPRGAVLVHGPGLFSAPDGSWARLRLPCCGVSPRDAEPGIVTSDPSLVTCRLLDLRAEALERLARGLGLPSEMAHREEDRPPFDRDPDAHKVRLRMDLPTGDNRFDLFREEWERQEWEESGPLRPDVSWADLDGGVSWPRPAPRWWVRQLAGLARRLRRG